MNPLYNAGIGLYAGAAYMAGFFSEKPRKMISGQSESMRTVSAGAPYDLWIHAASLGEYEQGRPIIEEYQRRQPDARILLTFFSPSGYDVATRKPHPGITMAYLPFDTPDNAADIVEAARPRRAIFVKYEFWGNYLEALYKRGVPVSLISAVFRPGQIFFRPWGGMFRRMLKIYSKIYVQDEASRTLLASVGVDSVVAGDTRFDRVVAVRETGIDLPAVDVFCKAVPEALTLVAGSSWGADEDRYFTPLKQLENVRAIIAPHEFDEARLDHMLRKLGTAMLYSEFVKLVEKDEVAARARAAELRYLDRKSVV